MFWTFLRSSMTILVLGRIQYSDLLYYQFGRLKKKSVHLDICQEKSVHLIQLFNSNKFFS